MALPRALQRLAVMLVVGAAVACSRKSAGVARSDAGAVDASACIARPSTRPVASKRATVDGILRHSTVFLHLDARRADVVVPAEHRGDPRLVLQVGYDMATPIPDLQVTGDGVSGTLSFHQHPFFCRVPWSAVYALRDEGSRGGIWFEDVPRELRCAE